MGNSCRSQMAEGWARHLKSEQIDAYSAGVDPRDLDNLAVKVMSEVGVDISLQTPKHVNLFRFVIFDYVVTVCDRAHQACPPFLTAYKIVRVGFDDPQHLAKTAKTEADALIHYRRVRDEIKAFIQTLPDGLEKQE